MTSTQLAYTTVRLSAFNYYFLQLTQLVLRHSLQNNAYRYLTEVSIFTERQGYNYKHESNATLIEFDCPLNMESMVLVNVKKACNVKVSWKYYQHLMIILNRSRGFIYPPSEWLCPCTSLPFPPRLVIA